MNGDLTGDANCSTRMKTYCSVYAAIGTGQSNLAFAFSWHLQIEHHNYYPTRIGMLIQGVRIL